jgi:hypothetical protein
MRLRIARRRSPARAAGSDGTRASTAPLLVFLPPSHSDQNPPIQRSSRARTSCPQVLPHRSRTGSAVVPPKVPPVAPPGVPRRSPQGSRHGRRGVPRASAVHLAPMPPMRPREVPPPGGRTSRPSHAARGRHLPGAPPCAAPWHRSVVNLRHRQRLAARRNRTLRRGLAEKCCSPSQWISRSP